VNIRNPILLLFAVIAPLGIAQADLPLSLKRSVEIALAPDGSTRVALAEESLKQATEKVNQARHAYLPVIDASVVERSQTVNLQTFGLNFDFNIPGFSFPSLVGPFGVFDMRTSAQQPVLDFGIIRKLRAARSSESVSKYELETARDGVADRVARAYLTALRADAALETAKANVDLADALGKLAESQRQAGTGTGIEVTRAQVQLANNRQRMIVAENDRRRAELELFRAMGLDLNSHVSFTDKLSFRPVDVNAADAELARARAERAELKTQKQREETARLNLDAVKAESLPSVAAFGDYGGIGRTPASIKGTNTVGVSLKIPIFDMRRNGRRADSVLAMQAEKIRTRDLEQQVELEVRLALDSLRSAQAQVETAQEGLTLAENELAQARRRYEAGVTNSIEVTDAQTRLDRARDNRIAALYNYSLARIDLASATGTITEYVNQ
jgi:outer membrane protein TolC